LSSLNSSDVLQLLRRRSCCRTYQCGGHSTLWKSMSFCVWSALFISHSSVTRLPVIYVLGRRKVDIDLLVKQFQNEVPDNATSVLLMCDTAYAHSLDPIYERLRSEGYSQIERHPIPNTTNIVQPNTLAEQPLLPESDPLPETTLLLVAEPQDSTTTLLTYHHQTSQIYTFSPSTSILVLSSPSTNLALRRRYVAVQKARDAGAVGLVIGTLGKSGYLTLISLLRKLCLERRKKPYLLALGKLNPAKVANFSECDVFCMIACPESTVVDSSVLSPFFLW